ncbi:MAG: hypothetical protein JW768_14335 [Chitinispirillaceae bacterium]|nr:hypothetical protein [Chitinispirillaceae bacterium]
MAPDAPESKAPEQTQVFRMEPECYIATYFLFLLFIGLVVVAYLPLLVSLLTYGVVYAPLQRASMYLSATYVILLLLARFAHIEISRVQFILTPSSLVHKSTFSFIEIPYQDMTRCDIRTIPLIKGFIAVSAPGKRIILPSTITRFGDLAACLVKRLQAAGNGALCSAAHTHTLRRIALVTEFSHARSRAAFFPLVYATVCSTLANAFIAAMIWNGSGFAQVVWTGITLFMPLLVYGLADFRLNRSLAKQLKRDPACLPHLTLGSELLLALFIVGMSYALLGIAFKAFFVP